MFDKNRKEIDFMNPKVKPPANLYDDKGIPVQIINNTYFSYKDS